MYKRSIEADVKKHLFSGKIITIYGPRQVGKTTLVKKLLADFANQQTHYFNCDEADVKNQLETATTSTQLKTIIGNAALIVIDEAQRIKDIGLKLKLLVDNYPKQQIIATGSSAFELSQTIVEPLTGRNWEYWLYPLTVAELSPKHSPLELNRLLDTLLIYGTYPAVLTAPSLREKQEQVSIIAQNYLYKDLLNYEKIRNSELISKLLEALALQIGLEVSHNELAQLLDVNKETIRRYIELLKKAFIIFELPPFSRNSRKELGKMRKIYFYDLGVRNALIRNLNPLTLRSDVGQIWENFVVIEKAKTANFITNRPPLYFWRTYDQQEIDLVEDKGGQLAGWEITWGKAKKRAPKAWRETYPSATWQVITRINYLNLSMHSP